MEEKVGKGCECIFPFEKHYINLLFNERIEEEKKKLQELQEQMREAPAPSRLKDMLISSMQMYKTFIYELETVRDRFKSMPDCK